MLERLSIDNYALIDKTGVGFKEGFTVITGETGAGKSIMLDALGLLAGSRADSKAMGTKEKKTIVEAVFGNPPISLKSMFESYGLEWDPKEVIIRREISTSGKSRGFVNDTPVTLQLLSAVSENLLDIHSQHGNHLLSKSNEQLAILDAFTDNEKVLAEYRMVFKKYVALRNRLRQIKENISKGKENREFLMFRLEQLDKLKPKKGELQELEREYELLGDADRFKNSLNDAYSLIGGTEGSALKLIQTAVNALGDIDVTLLDHGGSDNLEERLNTLKIELRDITDTLESYSEQINSDPERFEKVRDRIERIYEAQKKFKVKDEEELVTLHESLKRELSELDINGEDLGEREKQLRELGKELKEKADSLSLTRERAAMEFSQEIVSRLRPLGMPNVRFEVTLEKGKITSEGQDHVMFSCSFNKNHALQPVSDIASGGETARVMLAIKSLMSKKMDLPTVIFDEIDTGVSGEIAHKMGAMMKEMSEKIQVIAVTHLPQVAAIGNHHLKVYKTDEKEKTVSQIKELKGEERVKEIAGMLSGTSIEDVALENARMLLQS